MTGNDYRTVLGFFQFDSITKVDRRGLVMPTIMAQSKVDRDTLVGTVCFYLSSF
jgi:hypothetical protein